MIVVRYAFRLGEYRRNKEEAKSKKMFSFTISENPKHSLRLFLTQKRSCTGKQQDVSEDCLCRKQVLLRHVSALLVEFGGTFFVKDLDEWSKARYSLPSSLLRDVSD